MSVRFIYGRILLGFQNLLNSEKGRLRSLRQTETKRMRFLKTAELEMKGYFYWLKTGDDDIFVVRYLNNMCSRSNERLFTNLISLRNLQNLPAFEAEGFKTFEICHFSGRCRKEYVFDVYEVYEKQKRQKMYQKNTPYVDYNGRDSLYCYKIIHNDM